MSETTTSNLIAVAVSDAGAVTFRNNTGAALDPHTGRVVRYGLGPGSPDRVGWVPVTIRPEHVGRTLAVFVGIEAKTPTSHTEPKRLAGQRHWLESLAAAGGIAMFASDRDRAAAVIRRAVDGEVIQGVQNWEDGK